jgi:hypothetical protein
MKMACEKGSLKKMRCALHNVRQAAVEAWL